MPSTDPHGLVPLRWPAAWTSDRQLALLENTPINCVIDAPAAVATAAKSRGLTVLSKQDSASVAAFLPEPVWPSIKMQRRGQGADAGPTGAPWVDANGWSIQLARALSPNKPVWVDAGPPDNAVLDDRNYTLAIAEPAAFGGQWVVNIDKGYASKLADGDAATVARWRKLMDTLKFFEAHRNWRAMDIRSNLAVVSDFAGPNEFLSREFLNLASRRNVGYHVWLKATAPRANFSAVQSVLFIDEQPPAADLARALDSFVRKGGMLIARRSEPFSKWTGAATPTPIPGYETRSIGKGQLVMPTAAWDDPWQLALDVKMLIGRKTDTVRFYNAGIMGTYYTRSNDGRAAVLHLVNYTRRAAPGEITVAVADPFKSARVVTPDAAPPKQVAMANQGGVFREMALPGFPVYAAVELS